MSNETTIPDSAAPADVQDRSPDYMPPLSRAIPLGLQHIMAMLSATKA